MKKKVKIIVDDHVLSFFNVDKNDYVRINDGKIKVYITENGDPNEEPKLSTEFSNQSFLTITFIICAVFLSIYVILIFVYFI